MITKQEADRRLKNGELTVKDYKMLKENGGMIDNVLGNK